MTLVAAISYGGEGVACFDPEKVLHRLQTSFPEAVIDPTERAEAEVAAIDAFLEQNNAAPETRDRMKAQIRGKARRNGPVYGFTLPVPEGTTIEGLASRYSVHFRADSAIDAVLQRRIVAFLEALGLGTVRVLAR